MLRSPTPAIRNVSDRLEAPRMSRPSLPCIGSLVVAVSLLATACADRPSGDTTSRSVYDRVLATKSLRVAYISYPPSFVKDSRTGDYSGVMHDALREIAGRMELQVEFVEETAWGTMIEAVRSGRVDLVCTGLWPNATRGKFVDFSDPVYFSPVRAYVRAGNTQFDGNLEAINSPQVRIATIDGEMTSIIAKADFPRATAQAYPQSTDIAQMLLEVGTGKADVTFVEPVVASGFLKQNPGSIQEVKNISPLRVFPNVLMVAKGELNLLNMLNTALAEAANTGEIDRIVAKYEDAPGLLLRRALPYRSPEK